MSEENKNVVEIGNDVSNEKTSETKKTDWEKMLENMMQRAYLSGLSCGMKTMCGSILERLNKYQKQRMNPQMQLIELRKWCMRSLNVVNEPNKQNDSELIREENGAENDAE